VGLLWGVIPLYAMQNVPISLFIVPQRVPFHVLGSVDVPDIVNLHIML